MPLEKPLDLNASETALALPYQALAECVRALLQDDSVRVPARIVQPLQGGGSLFVMPACDAQVAMTKLITFVAGNPAQGLPAIQGDVVVFDPADGQRQVILHGPTVTARRTAAVSLLAAQTLAPNPQGRAPGTARWSATAEAAPWHRRAALASGAGCLPGPAASAARSPH